MSLGLATFFILLGIVFLLVGGEALLRASISIAVRFRISPATIGLTIIAAGTSAPELFTSALAAFKGAPDISIGNVVGSNIFNILGILGLSCIITNNKFDIMTFKVHWPFLLCSSILLFVLSLDGSYHRYEGLSLCALLIAFVVFTLLYEGKKSQKNKEVDEDITTTKNIFWDLGYLTIGFVGLALGAHLALEGAVTVGRSLGMSERLIGITIISVGTGLPELATSLVAAVRGHSEIAIANVIGSNIMNTLGIIGVTSTIFPIRSMDASLGTDFMWMIGATLVLFFFMRNSERQIKRPAGVIMLLSYVTYIALLIF